MKKSSRTNDLTNALVKWLNAEGYFVWRQNNVGIWDAEKKIYRKGSTKKGVPDILGISKMGKALAIEVKTGKDKLSDEQIDFKTQWEKRGGIYIVVKQLDSETIKNLELIK